MTSWLPRELALANRVRPGETKSAAIRRTLPEGLHSFSLRFLLDRDSAGQGERCMAASQLSLIRSTIKTTGCYGWPEEPCGRRRAEIFKRSPTATEKDQAPFPTHEKARAIHGPGDSWPGRISRV